MSGVSIRSTVPHSTLEGNPMKGIVRRLCAVSVSMIIAASLHPLSSQEPLKVIRATSALVDIRDGCELKTGAWRISPRLKPDIYTTSKKESTVTFYTDIDSISFLITKSAQYDFIIVLNDKDSAFTRIIYKPTYLEVLRSGSHYDQRDNGVSVTFTYTPMSDPALLSIRSHFKLDSIAGTGGEVDRLLNVLHWVHTTFPHDGAKDAPPSSSLEDLMNKCIAEKKTLDCGSLARVLNVCYLALGFPSRRIVCLPEDSTDVDCHSINAVYSSAYRKWLWVDPTFDAYVMDEHGQLLGIDEVRERLIKDKPLTLTPDANWNHVNKVEQGYYLQNYMAKNLYALEYFYESDGAVKSILLLPVEYEGVIPRTRIFNPMLTHSPNLFWQPPR
jgi:hypothetical protein